MYCRNCGKPIPDDCKFCPFCGCSIQVEETQTSTSSNGPIAAPVGVNNQTARNPLPTGLGISRGSKNEQIFEAVNKLGEEKTKKLVYFSTVFKISTILGFVGILVYFAGAPIITAIDSHSESTALNFQTIYKIFMIIYSTLILVLNGFCIVLLAKYKKTFEIKNIKVGIVPKVVCSLFTLALIVLLIVSIITKATMDEPGILIPCMVLTGLNFVLSGLNASTSQMFCLLPYSKYKKIIKEQKEIKK